MIANRHRGFNLSLVAVVAVAAVVFGARVTTAQGACTMEKVAGTYAYEFHGSGTYVLGAASTPRHWMLQYAPVSSVGWMRFEVDGTMHGAGWTILGRATSGLDGAAMIGKLIDLDPETCTAEIQWTPTYAPTSLHRERLLFVKNAQEFRSVLIDPPSHIMAWSGQGRRITGAPGEVSTCGPHLLAGDLLLQTEGLALGAPTDLAGRASILRLAVADDGSYAGTLYTIDPTSRTLPVDGAFDVLPNCTFAVTLTSPGLAGVQHGRGVLFDQGKAGFVIMPLQTTLFDGSIVKPVFARGDLLSLGR